jgi:hypothetical protein
MRLCVFVLPRSACVCMCMHIFVLLGTGACAVQGMHARVHVGGHTQLVCCCLDRHGVLDLYIERHVRRHPLRTSLPLVCSVYPRPHTHTRRGPLIGWVFSLTDSTHPRTLTHTYTHRSHSETGLVVRSVCYLTVRPHVPTHSCLSLRTHSQTNTDPAYTYTHTHTHTYMDGVIAWGIHASGWS